MSWLRRELKKLNWLVIGNVIGNILLAIAGLMILPVVTGLIYHEMSMVAFFLITIGISLILGFPLSRIEDRKSVV